MRQIFRRPRKCENLNGAYPGEKASANLDYDNPLFLSHSLVIALVLLFYTRPVLLYPRRTHSFSILLVFICLIPISMLLLPGFPREACEGVFPCL